MGKKKNLQFVWPKDGPKGHNGYQGFFGRLRDILTNRGPDIFLQRMGSSRPIRPDCWGNWDSYHHPWYHFLEEGGSCNNGLWNSSRGSRRYDPLTRRYKKWASPHDWYGLGVGGFLEGEYPRFTQEEWRKMARQLNRNGRINPSKMGKEWHQDGPKRFRQEHDWFWQNAHRVGENRREGLHPLADINPHLRMHQMWPQDLDYWLTIEGLI